MPATPADTSPANLLGMVKACADETRLRLIYILSAGELSVGELVDILGQSQPRVSRHIKLLAEAGLIDRFQEGTQVFCRLSQAQAITPLLRSLTNLAAGEEFAGTDRASMQKAVDQRAQTAQAYFEKHAASWNALRSLYVPEAEVEAALLKRLAGKTIARHLDIGTGTGRMLALFADQSRFGLGVDISSEMLRYAREQLSSRGLQHVQARKMDMYEIAGQVEPCDLITIHQVLHFSEQPRELLSAASNALAVDGRILLVDFEPHNHEELRREHAHRKLGFARDDLAAMCATCNLTISHYQSFAGAELTAFIAELKHREDRAS